MIFGSCHFLCHQFTQRNEPNQIIADMDVPLMDQVLIVHNYQKYNSIADCYLIISPVDWDALYASFKS